MKRFLSPKLDQLWHGANFEPSLFQTPANVVFLEYDPDSSTLEHEIAQVTEAGKWFVLRSSNADWTDRYLSHPRLVGWQADRIGEDWPSIPVPVTCFAQGRISKVSADKLDFISYRPEQDSCRSFEFDLVRSLKPDAPWLLVRNDSRSVNPDQQRFEVLQALAHGADGIYGYGDSIGSELESLSAVAGSEVVSDIALLFDWEGMVEPDQNQEQLCVEYYQALRASGYSVDLVGTDAPLEKYRIVVAPCVHRFATAFAEKVAAFVENGGAFVASRLPEGDPVWEQLLGVRIEQRVSLPPNEPNYVEVMVSEWCPTGRYQATDFCSHVQCEAAEIVGTYTEGDLFGCPALTANPVGQGMAFFVGSRNEREFLKAFLSPIARRFGAKKVIESKLPLEVSAMARESDKQRFIFLMNGGLQSVGFTTEEWGEVRLAPHDVAVMLQEKEESPLSS